MEFQVPFACKTDGFWVSVWSNTVDFDVVLYDGTTALQTVSFDGNAISGSGGTRHFLQSWASEQELAANTTYRLAVKPTTASTVRIDYFDVNAAGHMTPHAFGQFGTTSRVDGGSWAAATTTRRLHAGLRFSAFHDGAGGGGGDQLGQFNRGFN
jgi:hypothetical protein